MPGQAGDAPGMVRLFDDSGRMLNEAPVDMVQLVEDVQWSPRNVQVRLVFDFPLKPGP
jgi:hypothetical protein